MTGHLAGVALLIVDVQYDFIDGTLAVEGAQDILPVVQRLIKDYSFELILASQDYHPKGHISFASSHKNGQTFQTRQVAHPIRQGETIEQMLWPDHCVQGTRGAEIHDQVKAAWQCVNPPAQIVRKGTRLDLDGYSAFSDNAFLGFTELPKLLYSHQSGKPIDTLVVVGLATDYCVKYTAIDARKFNFRTIIVESAVRGVAKETIKSAIEELQSWGVEFVKDETALQKTLQ